MRRAVIAFLLHCAASRACPGHGGAFHARCEMVVTFDQPCAVVLSEVVARVTAPPDSWSDPNANGTYALTRREALRLEGSRKHRIEPQKSWFAPSSSEAVSHTDMWDMDFAPTRGEGCEVCARRRATAHRRGRPPRALPTASARRR